MERAGIYVRISSDALGEGLGVARQESDCRGLAERRGWSVQDVYTDNDVSAFSGKPRPSYRRLLEDIGSGRIDGVIAWHGDRLHRSPLELETFIGLIETTGCQVATVQSGELDLSTPSGRLNARVVGSFARYESEHKSRRVRRKLEENAIAGKHHGGSRPYGWQDDRVTLDLAEAANVRKAIDMLLAGNSVLATVRAMNAAGARNTRGKAWTASTVRPVVLRARNAGLRQHQGVTVGPGLWEPIVDVATYDRVRVLLTDPARRTTPGAAGLSRLLSGIARCGVCGGPLRAAKGKAYKGKASDIYRCGVSSCVTRDLHHLEGFVSAVVCARLGRPDAADLLRSGEEPPSAALARQAVEDLRSRLDVAAADYADGSITSEQLRTITSRVHPRLLAAERLVPPPRPDVQVLESLVGAGDVEKVWSGMDVSVQRRVLGGVLLSVVVNRTRPGHGGFNPASVTVEWKGAG